MRQTNIVNMAFGSHLYGLSTPQSDMDYAGIYMPSLREVLLNKPMKTKDYSTGKDHEKNTSTDVDTKVYSLPVFLGDALRGDTSALDMLHCDTPITTSWVWQDLVKYRKMFYSKNMKAYCGYVRTQAHKYGLKGDKLKELKDAITFLKEHGDLEAKIFDLWDTLPEGVYIEKVLGNTKEGIGQGGRYWCVLGKQYQDTNSSAYVLCQLEKKWESYGHRAKQAMTNDGVDWKALSHALRVGYQVEELYKNGDFNYPLAETDFILRVKQGNASYKEEVIPELDRILENVDLMSESSGLPDKPDVLFWDNWLIGVFDEWFNITYVEV